MADFGNFGDEVKKSLNRKIDYQREKFLKGISTSRHGKKEDPTYLHFRFIFDEGISSRIDPETFLAPSPLFRPYKDPAKKTGVDAATGDSEGQAPDEDTPASFNTEGTATNFFYGSKFKIEGMLGGGAFDPQEGFAYMGAQEYLYQRSTQRRDMLNAFRNGFLYINKNSPYYFQSISGLDQLLKADIKNIHKGSSKPQRMGTLTIDCLESIDMRIFALSELYRKGIYDYTYHRSMLPENLRKFRMWLIVTEIRNIQLSYGLGDVLNPFSIPSVANIANSLDSFNSQTGLLDKISGDNQKSTNTENYPPNNPEFGGTELGPYAFIYQFDQCEFDFDDSYPSYGTIDNKGSGPVTNKFKIHVGRVKDYKIQFNELSDILQKNDNIKQMVLNDTWGSTADSYRDYDYKGSDGISGLPDNIDEADPAGFFKQMASNFITNTVADLKNIGVSKLENALLGNIYGLGGINAGAALRSGFSVANTFNDLKNNGIPNPFEDNRPQAQGLGGPGQRQYPTINEDAYTGSSSQNDENLGNVLGGGANPPGTLSGDVYPNVPGKDLGVPDRVYPSNNSDEYNNVPGSDSGVPGRVYPVPGGDVYPGVPGADLGVPDRQYPSNNSDEYNNVPGSDSGVPDRVYPVPVGDVYPTVPGADLGVPDRQYSAPGGDEYNNVPGSDLGVIGRVYPEPVGDVYPGVPGSDLGAPDRQYPQAEGNEYPEGSIVTEPNFTKIYPDANNKYPQVNDKEYKDSPKGFIDNMGDVYKNVPGSDLGGIGRNYGSVRSDEYQTIPAPAQINLGRTYPKSNNSENS
jgi:hypothetical protein